MGKGPACGESRVEERMTRGLEEGEKAGHWTRGPVQHRNVLIPSVGKDQRTQFSPGQDRKLDQGPGRNLLHSGLHKHRQCRGR